MAVFTCVNIQITLYFWDCVGLNTTNNLLPFFTSFLYFLQLNFLDQNIQVQKQNMNKGKRSNTFLKLELVPITVYLNCNKIQTIYLHVCKWHPYFIPTHFSPTGSYQGIYSNTQVFHVNFPHTTLILTFQKLFNLLIVLVALYYPQVSC